MSSAMSSEQQSSAPPQTPAPLRVLFVCTGNICRSPAAEYLLRDYLGGDHPGIAMSSAGVAGLSGHPMDSRSVDYLKGRGIDGNGFSARRVSRRILEAQDLVVCFEQRQVDSCLITHPGAMSKTFRLPQLAQWHRSGLLPSLTALPELRHGLPRVDGDVEDPVGFSSAKEYTRVLEAIDNDVAELSALLTYGR
ncbi:arsenate reductase/protein-tyrosine-phosphatase family protein [Corynebacterium provencense]|uniref:arsenate reductase/protein-tyrosine-phosphatase family protein n=1 Tax=Corynebacterium provencense TaxID=1737425 RepID=UPI000AA0A2DE|nr:protein tyrosine phosphatase [Corynebacterium provencense]